MVLGVQVGPLEAVDRAVCLVRLVLVEHLVPEALVEVVDQVAHQVLVVNHQLLVHLVQAVHQVVVGHQEVQVVLDSLVLAVLVA